MNRIERVGGHKLALRLKETIQERARKNYQENVGRPKSSQLVGTITEPLHTNKELGKLAGVF